MKKIWAVVTAAALMLTGCGGKKKMSGDMRFADSGGGVCGDGMTYFAGGVINYVDLDSMERTVLCAKPNCNHTSSDCVGRCIGEAPILYGDHVYFLDHITKVEEKNDGGKEFVINSKLCRVSLDSSEIETIAQFHDCAPSESGEWFIRDGMAWFIGDDLNPQDDGYGAIISGNCGGCHFLCSVDLATGEYVNYGSIYDGDKKYEAASNTSTACIRGVYGNKIMIDYEYAQEMPPSDLPVGYDFRSLFVDLMFEFDFAKRELAPSEMPVPAYVDEETYVYTENGSAHVVCKDGEYDFPSDEWLNLRFVNGKLFDPAAGKWFDTADMSEHSMGEYAKYFPVAYHGGCYVLKQGGKFVKLTEEELRAL